MDGATGSGREKPAEFELVRLCIAPEGAFGVLLADGLPAGPLTLERTYPLLQSKPTGPQMTKIARGRYRCVRTYYYKGQYETFEILVPGHSRLLFHCGNTETDATGCVLLGRRFGTINGAPALLESRTGFAEFMLLNRDRTTFDLEVRSA